jgi:hypothetical protein
MRLVSCQLPQLSIILFKYLIVLIISKKKQAKKSPLALSALGLD